MKSEIREEFYKLAQEFRENQFNLVTVSNIIVLIRRHRKHLSTKEVKLLLQIPINLLDNDVELINEKKWVNENGSYFWGNITWTEDEFTNKWKEKFSSNNFNLNDMSELCKIVANDFEGFRSSCEFVLRNPEVTLRDDVKLKKSSDFIRNGEVFYDEVLKAIYSE